MDVQGQRGLPLHTYLVNVVNRLAMHIPVHEFGDNLVCTQKYDVTRVEFWELKPVMDPDGKKKTSDGLPVFYIRGGVTKKFVVTQWSWHPEGWVYYETKDMHENAEFVFVPALDAHGKQEEFHLGGKSYPVFRIRDLMHKKYLGALISQPSFLVHFGDTTNAYDFKWAPIPIGDI
jgi:hypothetical protein